MHGQFTREMLDINKEKCLEIVKEISPEGGNGRVNNMNSPGTGTKSESCQVYYWQPTREREAGKRPGVEVTFTNSIKLSHE